MTIPAEIDTPDIMIDVDILERNIARMAAAVRDEGPRPPPPRQDPQDHRDRRPPDGRREQPG